MTPPREETVAVVIPCRNGERYLEEALASVSSQAWPIAERVLVDDGSSDASAEIAESAGWKVVPSGGNASAGKGVSAARNLGIRSVSSSLVALLDADDWWLPTHLERLVPPMIADERLSMAFGAMEFSPGGRVWPHPTLGLPVRAAFDAYPTLLSTSIVPSSSVVIRRASMLDSGGFPVDLSYGEDCYGFWRLSRQGPCWFDGESTAIYRRHPDQTSSQLLRSYSGSMEMRRKQARCLQADDPLRWRQLRSVAARGWEEIAAWYWYAGEPEYAATVLSEMTRELSVRPSWSARIRSGMIGKVLLWLKQRTRAE